jgi:hypothetical protein
VGEGKQWDRGSREGGWEWAVVVVVVVIVVIVVIV